MRLEVIIFAVLIFTASLMLFYWLAPYVLMRIRHIRDAYNDSEE